MKTAKLTRFTNYLTERYALRGGVVQHWRGASRRSANIIEISIATAQTLIYVKDRTEPPGWWGLNENQVSILRKSNIHWFLILLVGKAEVGYILTDEQVNQGIHSDRWSRDPKEYKLHEGSELVGATSFKTFAEALSIIGFGSKDTSQRSEKETLKEKGEKYSISEDSGILFQEIKQLIEDKENQYTNSKLFDPQNNKDGRDRVIAAIVRRRGQPKFRKQLIKIYQGRCAITGTDSEHVLEAAHILPYNGKDSNHPSNGLLLRADVHILFDLRLIAIDTTNMKVLVSPRLMGTYYKDFAGKLLRLPQKESDQPSKVALDMHRQESNL